MKIDLPIIADFNIEELAAWDGNKLIDLPVISLPTNNFISTCSNKNSLNLYYKNLRPRFELLGDSEESCFNLCEKGFFWDCTSESCIEGIAHNTCTLYEVKLSITEITFNNGYFDIDDSIEYILEPSLRDIDIPLDTDVNSYVNNGYIKTIGTSQVYDDSIVTSITYQNSIQDIIEGLSSSPQNLNARGEWIEGLLGSIDGLFSHITNELPSGELQRTFAVYKCITEIRYELTYNTTYTEH